jgi:hypothetical protein
MTFVSTRRSPLPRAFRCRDPELVMTSARGLRQRASGELEFLCRDSPARLSMLLAFNERPRARPSTAHPTRPRTDLFHATAVKRPRDSFGVWRTNAFANRAPSPGLTRREIALLVVVARALALANRRFHPALSGGFPRRTWPTPRDESLGNVGGSTDALSHPPPFRGRWRPLMVLTMGRGALISYPREEIEKHCPEAPSAVSPL